MTTGTDTDLLGQLAESVERAASLLAAGSRLAGPAAAQDDAADLVPGDEGAGVCLTFADGSVLTVFLVPASSLRPSTSTSSRVTSAPASARTTVVAAWRARPVRTWGSGRQSSRAPSATVTTVSHRVPAPRAA